MDLNELLAPAITGFLGGLTIIIAAIITSRSKKRESADSKIPDASAYWEETRKAQQEVRDANARAFFWEDAYHSVRGAFKGYIRRVLSHHPDEERLHLDEDEMEALRVKVYPGD